MRRSLVLDINLAQSDSQKKKKFLPNLKRCLLVINGKLSIPPSEIHSYMSYHTLNNINKERVRLRIKKRKLVFLKTNVSSHDQ